MICKRSDLVSIALAAVLAITAAAVPTYAQSSDQAFPTAVTSTDLSGTIAARDVGDPRLTTYYYVFDGGQGDIFINAVTDHLDGTIDIFTVDGLRSLAKIVVYAGSSQTETGRLIYLRKPERLLMRVQGRTPDDEAARFRIRFGGSFIAMSDTGSEKPPVVERTGESDIQVNSVGTIIAVKPKPAPPVVEKPAEEAVAASTDKKDPAAGGPATRKTKPAANSGEPKTVFNRTPRAGSSVPARKPPAKKETVAATPRPPGRTAKKETEAAKPAPPGPDPMAGVRLVIELKDGTSNWRPMTEVLRFGVDKGVLTVVGKDGQIQKFSVVDVARVTMQ